MAGKGMISFELGDSNLLLAISEMSHLCNVTFNIFMVQPSLSRAAATQEQLDLMSVTESHLLEMYEGALAIIASA